MTALILWVASAISCSRTMPQLVRAIRLSKADGVSLSSLLLGLSSATGWTVYGVMTDQATVAAVSALAAAGYAATYLYVRRLVPHADLAWVGTWVIVLTVTGFIGADVLGTVLAVAPLGTGILQIVAIRRPGGTHGVSIPSWSMASAEGALWLAYGLLVADVPITLAGACQCACDSWIVISLIARRLAARAASVEPLQAS